LISLFQIQQTNLSTMCLLWMCYSILLKVKSIVYFDTLMIRNESFVKLWFTLSHPEITNMNAFLPFLLFRYTLNVISLHPNRIDSYPCSSQSLDVRAHQPFLNLLLGPHCLELILLWCFLLACNSGSDQPTQAQLVTSRNPNVKAFSFFPNSMSPVDNCIIPTELKSVVICFPW
jgi:hypothetical protein